MRNSEGASFSKSELFVSLRNEFPVFTKKTLWMMVNCWCRSLKKGGAE